jgi:hypothetical protein
LPNKPITSFKLVAILKSFRISDSATRIGSQQRRFQFKECAQQFVRMDNVAATFATRVNNPTPATSGKRHYNSHDQSAALNL